MASQDEPGADPTNQREKAQATDEDVHFVDEYDDDEAEVHNKFRNVVVEGPGSKIVHEAAKTVQNRTIRKGTCVQIKGQTARPHLAVINEVFAQGQKKAKMINVTWLYRHNEVPGTCTKTPSAREADRITSEMAVYDNRQRRHVYLTDHQEDISVACVLHPCQVFFLGNEKGEPCRKMVLEGETVMRPWPTFVCRHYYNPKLEEIYSLEDDVYSGDEACDIEDLLSATKKFMSEMGIVLGKPEEAPNPVLALQRKTARLDEAAGALAGLIESRACEGLPGGAAHVCSPANAAAVKTAVEELKGSVYAVLTDELLARFKGDLARAANQSDQDMKKRLQGEAVAAVSAVACPSRGAFRRLAECLSKLSEKSNTSKLLCQQGFARVLAVWMGQVFYRIGKQPARIADEYELLHWLLLSLERVPPKIDDIKWMRCVVGLCKVVARMAKEGSPSWCHTQLQRAQDNPRYSTLKLSLQRIREAAHRVMELLLAGIEKAPTTKSAKASKKIGSTAGVRSAQPSQQGNNEAQLPTRAPSAPDSKGVDVPTPPSTHSTVAPPVGGEANAASRVGSKPDRKSPATASKKQMKTPGSGGTSGLVGQASMELDDDVSLMDLAQQRAPTKRKRTPTSEASPCPSPGVVALGASTSSGSTQASADGPVDLVVLDANHSPGTPLRRINARKTTQLSGNLHLQPGSGKFAPAPPVRPSAASDKPLDKPPPAEPNVHGVEWDAEACSYRVNYKRQGGDGSTYQGERVNLEGALELLGDVIRQDAQELAGGDPAKTKEKARSIWSQLSKKVDGHDSAALRVGMEEEDIPTDVERGHGHDSGRLQVKAKIPSPRGKYVTAEYDIFKKGIIVNGKVIPPDKWLDSIGVRTASMAHAHEYITVTSLELERSLYQYLEEACSVCGSVLDEDVLMMCESCDYLWHTYCLTPKLDAVPEGEWYCDECARKRKKQKTT